MTLHKLAGSLIVGKIAGYKLSREEEKLLQDGTMSGVTLFKENAESVSQLVHLIDSIYAACAQAVVAVDQEGGAVQRFDHVLSPLPSQMALAACADSMSAMEKIVAINCLQLKLLGVNCLLAPVLDVCCNPANPIIGSRSFGCDAAQVGTLGKEYIQSVLAEGLIPVGKHFPGHGDVNVDSHLDIPILDASREQLDVRELVPFKTCINDLPAVMVGHISIPAIDKDVPASLSHNVITKLLRNELGFKGLVMTDDMAMGAIVKNYDLGQAAVNAVAAGVDQILIGGSTEQIITVHKALMAAIEAGKLTEERLALSATRVAKFIESAAHSELYQAERIKKLEQCIKEDSQIGLEIMQSAICLLRGKFPDISQGQWSVLIPDHPRYKFELGQLTQLGNCTELRFPLDPSAEDIAAVINKVQGNCLLLGFRGNVYPGQIELAKKLNQQLLAGGHQLYGVEVDIPSGLAQTQELKNVIATFDPSDAAMTALSKLLLSKQQSSSSRCPV